MSAVKKKLELRNIHDFSSIYRATRKFHVRLSLAKQCQRNVPKKCASRTKFFFSLLSPFNFFFFVFFGFFFAFLVAVAG